MLTYVVGDLFQSPAQVLVNTVNTVGVMGKGLAKEFKQIFPEMFTRYQEYCEKGLFRVGQLWLYQSPRKWVLNFPTKEHWRSPSRPEYIEAGLQKFVSTYAQRGIFSVSFPMLGCGNGELDWDTQVRPLMEAYLRDLPIDVYVHLFRKDPFQPEHRQPDTIRRWLRSEPEMLPFAEVWEDLLKLIRKRPSFHTPGNALPFGVEIHDSGAAVRFVTPQGTHEIEQDQLLELWQQLRGSGFVPGGSMPAGLDTISPFVMAVLGDLPYLKPVIMSKTYARVVHGNQPDGLQMVPHSEESFLGPTLGG